MPACRRSRQTSNPSLPGSMTSRTTRSNVPVRAFSNAVRPSDATLDVVPLGAEVVLERAGNRRLVLDHQDAGHGAVPSVGSRMVNVLPFPGSLSTSTVPPCPSTMRRTSARPRPVPLVSLARAESPRTNFSKMAFRSRGAMPRPPSRTLMAAAVAASLDRDADRPALARVLHRVLEEVPDGEREGLAVDRRIPAPPRHPPRLTKPFATLSRRNSSTTSAVSRPGSARSNR